MLDPTATTDLRNRNGLGNGRDDNGSGGGRLTKCLTFSANTSMKSKKSPRTKCLYCGSSLKAQHQTTESNNNGHDKQMRKSKTMAQRLSFWHSSRWLYKNRKQRPTGCQCGANGEFVLERNHKEKKSQTEKNGALFFFRKIGKYNCCRFATTNHSQTHSNNNDKEQQ